MKLPLEVKKHPLYKNSLTHELRTLRARSIRLWRAIKQTSMPHIEQLVKWLNGLTKS